MLLLFHLLLLFLSLINVPTLSSQTAKLPLLLQCVTIVLRVIYTCLPLPHPLPLSPPLSLSLLQRLNYALQIEQRICRIALHFACVQHCELKCN